MRDIYENLKNHFRNNSQVEIAEGKGAQGIKYQGKMLAMFFKGDLSVKLKPESVKRLIENGEGQWHDPGTGKPMKDRILIPASKQDTWIKICELALSELGVIV